MVISQNNKRIAKNTLLLYGRMLITMFLNLYATRLTLANLGVDDMGVYGVVGSIVSSVTLISGSLTNAVQRFINYEMGCENGNVNELFTSCLNVILLMAVFFIVILETLGLWILKTQVVIPENSEVAASIVYQFSVISFVISIIMIPYHSIIIAKERMDMFALGTVLQVFTNCIAAYSISMFENRLVVYSLFLMLISLMLSSLYISFCYRNYKSEVAYNTKIIWCRIKEIGSFMASTAVSSVLYIIANQGIVFILNITYGVALNAVYSITNQVKNSFLSFATNINKAMSPQITQSFAKGDISRHTKLVYTGSKLNIFLLLYILIPFLLKTEYILHIWLDDVPEYTKIYTRAIMFSVLMECFIQPISGSVFSSGKVKQYVIYPQIIYLIVLPLIYFGYIFCKEATIVIFCVLLTDFIYKCAQVIYASKLKIINKKDIFTKVILRSFIVASASIAISCFMSKYMEDSIVGLIVLLLSNAILLTIFIYALGFDSIEKKKVRDLVFEVYNNKIRR